MQEKKEYFVQIYDTYSTQIFRFVYLKTDNTQLAEDITSETFMRLWRSIQNGKKIKNEKALLYTIARGIVVDHYRSKKYTNETSLFATQMDENAFEENDLVDKIYVKEQISQIFAQLNRIKKEYKEVLLLRFVDDLEYSEIAGVIHKKESTVRVLLHRAIGALKKQYE